MGDSFMSNEESMRIRTIAWHKASENEMSARIRCILQKWLPYAEKQFADWSGRPSCGHFFGGTYWYGLETAYTASVYALLAKLPNYEDKLTGIPREEVKRKAIAAIRYLGFTHDTGPEDCVRAEGRNRFCSLTKWGGRGQKFFPASQVGVTIASFGLSAWLLWEDLDEETRCLIRNVLTDYADRWCEEEPRNGAYFDTQTEENAWTAGGIAAALALFPNHPRHESWIKGFEAWSLNTITTPIDRAREPKSIKTVTFHPDFTTENHGFAHPGYICAGINLRGIHAVFSLIGDEVITETVLYNNERLYNKTIKVWAQFDGLAIPIQGQDWWYNRQHERQFTHAFMNVIHGDSDASLLERRALAVIEGIQNSNDQGCLLEKNGEQCIISGYQTAKDMEHTSAKDLVTSCLLHLFGGAGEEPSEGDEMNARLVGVYVYPYGCSVIHRTHDSFSSFSWRNRVMGLTIPSKGCWSITPLPASYTGTVEFEIEEDSQRTLHSNEQYVLQTEKENICNYEDGFGAIASLMRGVEELRQDVAFVSLPDGKTVYIECIQVLKSCKIAEMNTGMIGIRNEQYSAMPDLAQGRRTIYFPDRTASYEGFYSREPNGITDLEPAEWVQVDDEIGYVLFGSQGIRYINQHEYKKWKGVEDILILNRRSEETFESPRTLEPFVVITLPNRIKEETKGIANRAHLFTCEEEGVILLNCESQLIYANFNSTAMTVHAKRESKLKLNKQPLFEGINRIEGDTYFWSGRFDAFTSGFRNSDWTLEIFGDGQEDICHLEISVLPDRLYVTNRCEESISITLQHTDDGHRRVLELTSGLTEVLEF
jgi:hypothetical protein